MYLYSGEMPMFGKYSFDLTLHPSVLERQCSTFTVREPYSFCDMYRVLVYARQLDPVLRDERNSARVGRMEIV